jgi:hypothetical protein
MTNMTLAEVRFGVDGGLLDGHTYNSRDSIKGGKVAHLYIEEGYERHPWLSYGLGYYYSEIDIRDNSNGEDKKDSRHTPTVYLKFSCEPFKNMNLWTKAEVGADVITDSYSEMVFVPGIGFDYYITENFFIGPRASMFVGEKDRRDVVMFGIGYSF